LSARSQAHPKTSSAICEKREGRTMRDDSGAKPTSASEKL
jgi:hypothetical protein